MNPVSFYYGFDEDGRTLRWILAEITNTPWGERHCYVLPRSHNEGTAAKLRFRFGKDFHVSPFLPMDMSYDWRFTLPDSRLLVHMVNTGGPHADRQNPIHDAIPPAAIAAAFARFGADPATASSIFLTTATDVVSMGLLLGLATILIQ